MENRSTQPEKIKTNPFLDAMLDAGVESLIISSETGKAPLSGLMVGIHSSKYKEADFLGKRLYTISTIINRKNKPHIALIDTNASPGKDPISIKYICLVPTTQTNFYYNNFGKIIRSERRTDYFKDKNLIWRDYIYTLTYYSLLLIARYTKTKIVGITTFTYAGSHFEYIENAVHNFLIVNRNDNLIKEIKFFGPKIKNLQPSYNAPPHKELEYEFGYDDENNYPYVEFDLVSPFKDILPE